MKARTLDASLPEAPATLPRLQGFSRSVTSLRRVVEFTPAGQGRLHGVEDVAMALSHLMSANHEEEALRLAAHGLPKRHSIWWACLCTRAMPETTPTQEAQSALQAAEQWVREPIEAHRRTTMDAAQRTAFKGAESWLAMAAFWSSGSMAPPGQPVVQPPDHMSAAAVVCALGLASARRPEWRLRRLAICIEAALDMASGNETRRSLASL